MPGLGERMAEEQPELCWLAAGISAANRGAGKAIWSTDENGSYNKTATPETQPDEVAGWAISG